MGYVDRIQGENMNIDEENCGVLQEDAICVESDHLVTSARDWLEAQDVMNKDVVTIEADETVIGAAKMMARENISSVVIVEGGRVAGILTETDLVRRVNDDQYDLNTTQVCRVMSSPVVSIAPGESVLRAGEVMESNHIKRLPVLSNDRLVGIVTQTDMVRVLTSFGMRHVVSDIMSDRVFTIQRKESTARATEMMANENIASVVVLDDSEVVGVFTEKDYLKRVIAGQREPSETRVEEVMSSSIMTVDGDYSVFNAKKIMENTNIHQLVVIDEGEILGIVTQTDIFTAIKDKLQTEQDNHLQLLEDTESNIYTIDLEGITTYVNPSFMRLLEIDDREYMVGKPFLPEKFWIDPADRSKVIGDLKSDKVMTMELALKTEKGKEIYVTCFSTFTRNSHGEINGRQGTLHDITAGKVAEVELKEEMSRRQEVEEKLRKHNRSWFRFNKNPRIVKKWYDTESAYRLAVKAGRNEGSIDSVIGFLHESVDRAVEALKLAGEKDLSFAEVEELNEYLSSPQVLAKEAIDQTRHLLNWLGKKTPFEANLWFIEARATDH